jgi:hypothetical protein
MAAKKKTEETAKKKPEATTAQEIHHAPVETATPEHPFDDATLDVAADGALAAVKKTPAARQEALVQAWLARRNAAAIAEVARTDDAPAPARKAARRAVGVLKSRGIAVPERSSVVALTPKATRSYEARCLFPDGRGAQMWWIAKVESTGRTEVVEVTTVDRMGLMGLNRGTPTAGNLRQVYTGWQARVGRAPAEVPLEYARFRIAEARKQSTARKQVMPMGLDAAKELLDPDGKAGHQAPQHPIDAEELALPSEENAVKARLDKSMHLHEEPEFGSWLPEDPVGVGVLQTISERLNGIPEKERDQEKIDTVVKAVIDDACDAYFDEARKGLYVRRMKDAAWSLYRAGLVDRAIDALLVGKAIEKAGIVSDRPSEIAFVRGLVIKLLAVAQQRAGAMAPQGNEEAQRLEGQG